MWTLQHEGRTIGRGEGVCFGVEFERAREGQGSHDLRGGYEGVGGGVGVISPCEVPVVAGDDRVLLSFLDVLSVPLADAGTAGIGENQTPYLLQRLILLKQGEGELNSFPTQISDVVPLHFDSNTH